MTIDLTTLANWLTAGDGRLFCAAALFLTVWVAKNNERLRDSVLTTPQRKRAAVVLIAALPAAATALSTDVPIRDVLSTFATAVLGAMGFHGALDLPKPAKPAKPAKADEGDEADKADE